MGLLGSRLVLCFASCLGEYQDFETDSSRYTQPSLTFSHDLAADRFTCF